MLKSIRGVVSKVHECWCEWWPILALIAMVASPFVLIFGVSWWANEASRTSYPKDFPGLKVYVASSNNAWFADRIRDKKAEGAFSDYSADNQYWGDRGENGVTFRFKNTSSEPIAFHYYGGPVWRWKEMGHDLDITLQPGETRELKFEGYGDWFAWLSKPRGEK